MRSRSALVYLLALLAIVGGLSLTIFNRRALNRRLYERLANSGLRDERYHAALKAYAEVRKTTDSRPICVDKPFRSDCINIVIVRVPDDSDVPTKSGIAIVPDLRLNAIAMPPNLILVDARLLDFLTVQVFNDLISTVNRTVIEGGFQSSSLKTALAQARYREFGNIAHFFDPAVYPDAPSIWEMADKVLRIFDADSEAQKIFGKDSDVVEISRSYIATVYGLLLEHEIAHLTTRGVPHFAFSVESAIAKSAAPLVYQEEVHADTVALDQVQRETRVFSARKTSPDTQKFVQDPLLSRLPYLAYADFLTDLALYRGFEGFRGLTAKDLALWFLHKRCTPELDVRGYSSDPNKTLEVFFNDEERVDFARNKSLPILTKDEFDSLRTKLVHAEFAQTHAHNLVRAAEITKTLTSTDYADLERPRHEDYIQALLTNTPSQAFKDSSGFEPIPGTDIDRLLKGAEPFLKLVPAVTCPLEKCFVGTASHNDGFIEIVATKTQVARIRFVYNLHPGWAAEEDETEDAAKARQSSYVENMTMMLNFFGFLREDNQAQKTILIGADLRSPIFRCGLGSAGTEEEGIRYLAQSLTKPGWIEITVSSASSDLFH